MLDAKHWLVEDVDLLDIFLIFLQQITASRVLLYIAQKEWHLMGANKYMWTSKDVYCNSKYSYSSQLEHSGSLTWIVQVKVFSKLLRRMEERLRMVWIIRLWQKLMDEKCEVETVTLASRAFLCLFICCHFPLIIIDYEQNISSS